MYGPQWRATDKQFETIEECGYNVYFSIVEPGGFFFGERKDHCNTLYRVIAFVCFRTSDVYKNAGKFFVVSGAKPGRQGFYRKDYYESDVNGSKVPMEIPCEVRTILVNLCEKK